MQQRLNNLENKLFSPEDEDKNFSFVRKNHIKQEKRTGKGGDLCGFNLGTKSIFIKQIKPPKSMSVIQACYRIQANFKPANPVTDKLVMG